MLSLCSLTIGFDKKNPFLCSRLLSCLPLQPQTSKISNSHTYRFIIIFRYKIIPSKTKGKNRRDAMLASPFGNVGRNDNNVLYRMFRRASGSAYKTPSATAFEKL